MHTNTRHKKILETHTLKATPLRLSLLELLEKADAAVPYGTIRSRLKTADRVSLYRNLSIFEGKGIIHIASHSKGENYYALCTSNCSAAHNHNHIHFTCVLCGQVCCIELAQKIDLPLQGNEASEVDIQVKGRCAKCVQALSP